MRRLYAALALVLGLFLIVAPGVRADSGGSTDPDDTSGKLDVLQVSHSDTDTTVTLGLEFYEAWKPSDTPYYTIAWLFDFDNDGAQDDGCLIVEENDDVTPPNPLAFVLVKGNCDGGSDVTVIAAGTATRPTTTSLAVTFDRTRLAQAGQTGNSYKYIVYTYDSGSTQKTDTAPLAGPVTHTLSVPGSSTTTTVAASQSTATANPSTLIAGNRTTVTGGGFAPNTALKATLFSDPVVLANNFSSDANGKFSVSVVIPANTLPGTHRIVVSGAATGGGTHESTATITVALPRTGAANTGRTTATGAAVIALGFAVVMLAYYERRVVSVGASRAAAAVNTAFRRFDI
jgi:hypothetical protein